MVLERQQREALVGAAERDHGRAIGVWIRNQLESRSGAAAVGYIDRSLKSDRIQRAVAREDRDRRGNLHPGDTVSRSDPESAVPILEGTERARIEQTVRDIDDLAQLPVVRQDDGAAVQRREAETAVLQQGGCVEFVNLQVVVRLGGKRRDLLPVVEREQPVALRNDDPPIVVRMQEQLDGVCIGISAGTGRSSSPTISSRPTPFSSV